MFSNFKDQVTSQNQSQMMSLMRPPYPIMLGEQLASYMGVVDGQFLTLEDGIQIGPLKVVDEERIRGPRMIADMSLVRELHPGTGLTAILCGVMSPEQLLALSEQLPPALKLERHQSATLEPP